MKKTKAIIIIAAVMLIAVTGILGCQLNRTQLAAPVIKLEANVVSWEPVKDAKSYDVSIGSDPAVNVTTTSYTITKTGVGSWDITVTAKSDGTYLDSEKSNKVTYVQENKLNAPVITLTGSTVAWEQVEGASSYSVYVGETKTEVTQTSYVLEGLSAGSYEIYVIADGDGINYTDSEKSNTVTYTIYEPSLSWNTDGVKTVYYLDEQYQTVDLSGLTATYTDAYGEETPLNPEDFELSDYTLASVGEVMITLTYKGLTKTLFVEVKERTINDIEDYSEQLFAVNDSGVYDVTAKSVVDMKGNSLLNDDSTITLKQGKTLTLTDGKFVVYTVAQFISSTEQFNAISQDLDGYYVLTNDLDFDNVPQVVIGAAPIYNQNESGNKLAVGDNVIPTGTPDSSSVKNGVAFTGTLDGRGYVIKNYRVNLPEGVNAYDAGAYGIAMFGYLKGTVTNLTLRNVSVSGGKYVALLVGYNEGTIENIVVESTCSVTSTYSNGASICSYNYGTIKNVVSYVDKYVGFQGTTFDLPLAIKQEDENGSIESTVTNGYICDYTDLTSVLGGNFRYFEGLGTVLTNENYLFISTSLRNLPFGGRLYLYAVYMTTGDDITASFYGTNSADLELYWDGEMQSHYIAIKDILSCNIKVGDTVTFVLRRSDWSASHAIDITISEAVVSDYELITQVLDVIEGLDLPLEQIAIEATYTDGTTKIVNPVSAEGYDKNGTVGTPQQVKVYYGTGEEYFIVEVTPFPKQLTGIAVDNSKVYTTNYAKGDALDLTNLYIILTYDNQTTKSIQVTAQMIDEASYDMNVASDYNVKINYDGYSCTYTIYVYAGTLTSITATLPAASYKYGVSLTEEDLAGASITAYYSDDSVVSNIPVTLSMLTYDFSKLGETTVTVNYLGATYEVSVTVIDYAVSLTLTSANAKVYYSAYDEPKLSDFGEFALEMASGATTSTQDVTIGDYAPGLKTITFTYTEDASLTTTANVEMWYRILTVDDWAEMNKHLDGYYILESNLDFENAIMTVIGKQPVYVDGVGDTTCQPDTVPQDVVQQGVPFTGKFDGNGYTISNFRFNGTSFDGSGFGLSMFGYIGETGEVGGFTISGAQVTSKNQTGFVATVNYGTVKNIVIKANCAITAEWGSAGVIVYNESTAKVNNIVCYVTTVTKWDKSNSWALSCIYKEKATTSVNCVIYGSASYNALTLDSLGEGWMLIDGEFVYRGHTPYVVMDKTAALDGTLNITVYADSDVTKIGVYAWGVNQELTATSSGNGRFTVTVSSESGFVAGSSYNLGVRIDGRYYLIQSVEITEKEGV